MAKKTKKAAKPEEVNEKVLVASSFTLAIKGKIEDIVKFLLSLEKHRQLLTLTDISIKLDKYPVLEANFSLHLYSLSSAKQIGIKKQ